MIDDLGSKLPTSNANVRLKTKLKEEDDVL